MPRLLDALSEIFGFRCFRPHQEEIVRSILAGVDVFAVMPTGGGKSLCFQLPARMMDGICVVVSPLISLMKDQVDAANANGLRAATLNSSNSPEQNRNIGAALHRNEIDLLYLSPERFNQDNFIERLKTLPVSFFAVDEAHCISEWGHDFRPDYLALSRIVTEFPHIPVSAFTATATPKVANDIINRLGLRNPHITRASFNRPNLYYQVEPKEGGERQILEFLKVRPKDSGIIYRGTRKKVEATATFLQLNGMNAKPYHAGLLDRERSETQEAFSRDECQIIVATIAFGMGIDKSNVRFVVHADIPKNIEGYYQETGRAGRDGESAHCLLLFGRQDALLHRKFAQEIEDATAREAAISQLRQMEQFAMHDGCRRAAILGYFGEPFPLGNCAGCDICTGGVEREDATIPAQKALSAMHRTGGRFGAGQIIDILVGADTEKIRQYHHNELPTFGVGSDQPKSYWKRLIDALQAQSLAIADDPEFPVLRVSEEGWKVLKSQRDFKMIRQALTKKERLSKPKASSDEPYSEGLFELLRKERARQAANANVPPYVVFSDRTLHDMARFFPQSPNEMLAVNGVGQKKYESYGEVFLNVIAAYASENQKETGEYRAKYSDKLQSTMFTTTQTAGFARSAQIGELDTLMERTEGDTFRLIQTGKTIAETAELRGMRSSTIVGHLEKLLICGCDLSAEQFFAPERLDQIANWFETAKSWQLTDVVTLSDGALSYEDARLARAFLQKQLKNENENA